MDPRKIVQYQTCDGRTPFREWLLAIKDETTRARIRTRLDRLQLGNPGDFRGVGGGVFELRFHFGPGYRIYFGQAGTMFIVLLCGGDKSTQFEDVISAQRFLEDYQRRRK